MTTKPASAATDYEATIRVQASADELFDALTTTAGLAAWWNPATGSGETGGQLRFIMNSPDPLVIHVDQATRPTTVQWTVTGCPFLPDWVGTRPTFTITPLDGDTSELHFRHQGLTEELECIDMCTRSWNHYMTSLRDYLEAGRGSPFGSPADKARREAQATPSTPTGREGLALSGNIGIITRFEREFRTGDQAIFDELCDPGLTDHNPPPGHEPTLAGFRQKVADFRAAFPDVEADLQDIIASGDTVATRWVVTGSLQQEFMGIPANGQRVRVEGMNFYRLKDGRVTDIWTQFDGIAMMQQLGDSGNGSRRPVAYVISAVEGFADEVTVRRYAELAGPAIERFNGRFIISNSEPAVVEGESPSRHLSMVEFPSMEEAKAWYDSPEYAEARALTPATFSGRLLMFVEGV